MAEVIADQIPGSPEYEARMAALGDTITTTQFNQNGTVVPPVAPVAPVAPVVPPVDNTPPPADRPSWLPEKFKSVEDMASAYAALEQKLGGTTPPVVPEVPPVADPNTSPTIPEVPPTVPAGVDLPALEKEYAENGVLAPESYQALEKSGLTKEVVDAYIAGQQALTTQAHNAAYAIVGGEAKYREMIAWAATGTTPSERTSFNAAVANSDQNLVHLAIKGMEAKFVAANGRSPNVTLSGNAPAAGAASTGFASHAQITAAINDPRYSTDAAYRNSVTSKIALTPDHFFTSRSGH